MPSFYKKYGVYWEALLASLPSESGMESNLDFLYKLKQWLINLPEGLSNQIEPSMAALLMLKIYPAKLLLNGNCYAIATSKHILTTLKPKSSTDLLGIIEAILREFVVHASENTCPVCEEGYLCYWTEPKSKEIIMCCPECLNRQDLKGDPWESSNWIRPALKNEFEQLKNQ